MFNQLIESRATRERSRAQLTLSIIAHTVIIAAGVHFTQAAAAMMAAAPREREMIYTAPQRVPTTGTVSAAASATTRSTSADPPRPVAVPLSTPATIAAAADLPVPAAGFDPSRFGHAGTGSPDGYTARYDSTLVESIDDVDVPARYVSGPKPVYPEVLGRMAISGSVSLRYIVGRDGRAEAASLEALNASRPEFIGPALAAIRAAHFAPGIVGGHTVRQLVEQTVRFVGP